MFTRRDGMWKGAWYRSFNAILVIVLFCAAFGLQPTTVVEARDESPAPLLDAPPTVSLGVPAAQFIGQDVSFTVTFDNNDPSPGYGPLIDLIIPSSGADGDDGLGTSTITATYLGASVVMQTVAFDASCQAVHPYIRDNAGTYITVTCPVGVDPGDKLVSLRLPFGSFTQNQPPATVNVTVNMSNFADLGTPLTVRARGGYQFGYTPLDDWCCEDVPSTLSAWVNGSVTPMLFTVEKTYNGPESETATGPNFPRRYTVSATIASGQTMNPFSLTDELPDNLQFVSMIAPSAASCPTLPSTSAPGGTLTCDFGPASGTVDMTFEYYVPRLDAASGNVIDPVTGDDVTSCNQAQGTGSWTPLDPRDVGGLSSEPATLEADTCTNPEYTLTPKSIAIQKGVTVLGGGSPVPGSTLEYTLDFQVSDFFAFSNVIVTDVISDGQQVDPSFTPTLLVNGNGYVLSSADFVPANYTVDTSEIDLSDGPPPPLVEDPATDGTTTLTFRVSDEIISRGQNGRLVGGCVDPVSGSAIPDCGTYDNDGTTVTIVFRSVIQETFTDDYPSGDWSVDQGDLLTNNVNVIGRVLSTVDFSWDGTNTEPDTSSASVTLETGSLTKAIYAHNGNTSFATPLKVKPGDTVTYRLTYVMPFSDEENLELTDYLPLPVFHVGDPDENGIAGPAWVFDDVVSAAAPSAGHAKFGPGDTFRSYSGIIPTLASDTANNSLTFTYGDFDSTLGQSKTVDLLLTVTVSDDPFADGLYLTNEAHAYEGSTNGGLVTADAIVQIILTEPVLVGKKGIVATDNSSPAVTYVPTPPAPVTFNAPGTAGLRWSGTISSNSLAATPIDSNLSGVDAGDLVTFAIVIENQGSSINGAFDITIQDTLDALGFDYPTTGDPNSLNLAIYYGNGTGPIDYTKPDDTAAGPGDLFSGGIKLVDPSGAGVCQAHDPNLGNNVIIITYDLRVKNGIEPGSYTNTASITNYSGTEGGPDYANPDITDTASVTIANPDLVKTLTTTEINATGNDHTQAVIGELITYTLTTTFQEGLTPAAQIVDTLDAGLAFVDVVSITASNPDLDAGAAGDSGLYSSVMTFDAAGACTNCTAGTIVGTSNPLVENSGGRLTFDFGDLTNTDNNNATAETITIVYRVVALNVVGSQSGTLLNNSASLTWTGGSDTASAANVSIVEPDVNITKIISPTTGDAGDAILYTITLTGASTTEAYDVTLDDTFPAQIVSPAIFNVTDTSSLVSAANFNIAGNVLSTVTPFDMPVDAGRIITIQISGTIVSTASPGQTIDNVATVRWTSLDGNITDRSTYNTVSDERTGADGVGGALNDYAESNPATSARFTVNSVVNTKYIVATSESHTSDTMLPYTGTANSPRVSIGEIVRYRLIAQLPEGTSTNFQIDDNLPGGLTYLDDNTARVAFVSNGAGITSANVGTLPVPAIPAGCNVNGVAANGSTPAGPLPCLLADGNVGSSSSTSADPDTYTTSTDPQIKLGTLTNSDNDADAEFVVIEFNALVDNNSGGSSNDLGETRDNNFGVNINGTANGVVSGSVRITIAEPSIPFSGATNNKTVSPTTGDAGDTVTYTITYTNGGGVNNSDAFETRIADSLPADVTRTSAVGVAFNAACQSPAVTDNSSGNTIDVTVDRVRPGCQVTLTYTASLNVSVTSGQLLTNTANIAYTSLPGDNGTTSNSTGSSTPGAGGSDTGERNGTGTNPPNDHNGSDSATVTVVAAAPVKSIVSTTAVHTSEAGDGSAGSERDLAIGEVIRYRLAVTIPEGTTSDLQLRDTLPGGFTFLNDGDVRISFLANSDMTEEADLAGADNDALPPTFVLPAGRIAVAGQDVTFTIADLVTAGDLVNNDTDADAEYVVVDFNVRVNNDANNNNTDLDSNDFDIVVGGSTVSTSNTVGTRIVEPVLNITKAADDSAWLYGQTVTYTLNAAHDAASLADAFEVVVTDTIPTGLTYVPASITAPATWTTSVAGSTLTWTCSTANGCSLPLAGSAALTFQATVNTPPGPPAPLQGDDTAINTATSVWTSLPGDNNPGQPDGERDGSGGVNDYTDSGSHTGGLENYYSLGNRVWFDTNNNSLIDAGESGVNGVVVNLYSASDLTTIIATDTTSGGGYYLFDYLLPGDYVVAVAASNFDDGAVLDTYWSSGTTMNGTGVISEAAAPDADTLPETDSDDNGTLQSAAPLSGAVITQAVTLGPTGLTEPTGETDLDGGSQGAQPDGRANMTVDFGFYRTAIGNLVWLDDVAADGAYVSGESLVNEAAVTLFASDGTTEILVGLDGALGTSDDLAGGVPTTNASGVYSFTGLPQGDYIVKVVGPADTVSTTDASAPADTTGPNANVDNNDNGVGTVGNSVSANAVTMTPGSTGALNNNTVTNATGTTTNPTIDFGFAYPYALGNRVWFDTNNNSLMDGSEVGVDGVTVELYAADGTGAPTGSALATDTTANGGYYLFDNLFPGDYVVVIPASNFTGAGVLTGYWSSATTRAADGAISEVTAPDADDDADLDDNGTRQTSGAFSNAVISSAVTLGPTGLVEPANDDDLEPGVNHGNQPDGRSNLSVDFGFYRVAVGNLVFGDLNKNGTYDAGDTLLSGVAVELFTGDGLTSLGTDTTDASGLYEFTGLPDGDYIVRTTAPTGTSSTIDTFDQTDNDNPNTNTDDNDNGDGTANGAVSSAVVTLTAGSSGAANNNTIDDASGTTTNPTMDFGFSLAYALGNRVWFDTNNNSQIDFATEVGVDGVVVNLYSASDLTTVLATDTTSGGGYYLFNNLDAGDYVIVIPASNFATGAILDGYWSSGTTRNNSGALTEAAAPDADVSSVDSDDNGMLQTSGTFNGAVTALAVTIGPGGVEPTGETDLEGGSIQGQPDAQANMTVDFGFYTIQLGNLVWNDVNNSGVVDLGDGGLPNVDVQLWSSDLTTLLATDTTDGSGAYIFTDLPQGNYVVRIPASEFNPGGTLRDYFSSTGSAVAPYPYEPGAGVDAVLVDSDDNGTETGGTLGLGGYIQSSVFALTPAAEESVDNTLGLTREPRVDFGVYANAQTDLAVTKDDGTTFYIPGGSLTYTVTVTNNGPSDANGAAITDARPSQISSWTWTCAAGTPAAYNCSDSTGNPDPFTDSLDLPQGASVTYTVAATVDGAASGVLTNSITVTAPPGVGETNTTNNTDDDVDQPASLQVTKDDGLLIVGAGSTITYQIVVSNNGAMDMTSINVTDTLPADLTYQSATPAPTSVTGQVVTWSGLSLTAGSSTTISLTATVNASPSGASITNNVEVEDTNTGAGGTDDDTDTIATGSNFTKTLVGTDAVHTVDPKVTIGEVLTYEVVLTIPPGSMDNVHVVDTPQTGLAFVDLVSLTVSNPDTDTTGAADTGLYSSIMTFDGTTGLCTNCVDGTTAGTSNPLIENSGGKATFDLGTLTNTGAAAETVTIRYSVVVLDVAANHTGATLKNNVVWTWTGGNLQTTSTTVEVVEPDMSIDKEANAIVAPYGAPITFTIDVAHTADSTANAYDVVVTDVLPAGLEYIPGTVSFTGLPPTSNTYDPATFTLTFVWDEFPLGQSATAAFQAAFVGPSPVTNSSSVVWTSLPIDLISGEPVVISPYNPDSTERWYDPRDSSGLDNYGTEDSITINTPRLPETGFAPGVVTELPRQPESLGYTDLGGFWVEIPQLGVKLPIVGVPLQGQGWNLTWLGEQAGWLEGTAYPTHAGNSAITAHVYDAEGQPGPFMNLNKLYWGHKVIVHLGGQKYVYEVREVRMLWPDDKKVFRHEDYAWLTLITCKDFNRSTGTYAQRVVVRAVLMSVEPEQ